MSIHWAQACENSEYRSSQAPLDKPTRGLASETETTKTHPPALRWAFSLGVPAEWKPAILRRMWNDTRHVYTLDTEDDSERFPRSAVLKTQSACWSSYTYLSRSRYCFRSRDRREIKRAEAQKGMYPIFLSLRAGNKYTKATKKVLLYKSNH